ncbi:alpha/beta fold hydrolase [Chryseobacterium sp. Tr-659]|uniref:alpha/beta fold hydrolase n=1 Tax=Chryseobacterium sp. Tr-659 TaxID=2608340 RepID=UPI001423BEE8|nr:alpha/beta fold hydrolase [Chryseobacterium sp. Tr-659]NIF03960.1 alpha/beta fold hydrolase [Chryseobacterium sp. Tr-659]
MTQTLKIFFLILFALNYNTKAQDKKVSSITTSDHVKLYTKKSGSGPVCIFIHGGPGAWSASFENLGGNKLESDLSMIYYDQRGSGKSDNSPDGNYSPDRMIEDIEEIRKQYGADKVYLLAHSFGGVLATSYALKYPDHVKGIILANCTLNLKYSLQQQINYMNELMNTDFKITDSTLLPDFIKAKNALAKKGLDYKMLSDHKQNIELLNSIDSKNPSTYDFAQKAFSIKEYWQDYTPITQSIATPVLVITGTKDHSIGEDHYNSFLFPNKQVVKINGGHILYYEENKQFVKAIADFIRKTER